MSTESEDLFICGKCHGKFTDLNVFLTHRPNCNGEQVLNIYSLPIDSTFAVGEIESFIENVDTSNTEEPSELFYSTVTMERTPSNEFDLLFTTPVEQMTINTNENSSLELDISQMSLLECPVCDEQFDAPTVLENHVFEHSTWIEENATKNVKQVPTFEDSASSYTDLLDEPPTTPLECKQCTVTFTSNASLNVHKRMSKSFESVHCLHVVL